MSTTTKTFEMNTRVYCGRTGKWGIVLFADAPGKYRVMYAQDDSPFQIEDTNDLVSAKIQYPVFDIDDPVFVPQLNLPGKVLEIKGLDDHGLFSYGILCNDKYLVLQDGYIRRL